jgi:dienelactone hydrolase
MIQHPIASSLALLLTLALISGCAAPTAEPTIDPNPSPTAELLFSDNPARRGDSVVVRVTGLEAGTEVMIRAEQLSQWQADTLYRTEARFVADENGRIDLATDAPIEGPWSGADPNALFWTMRTTEDPPSKDMELHEVRVTVRDASGRTLAEAVLDYPPALGELIETPLGEDFPGAFVLRRPGDDPLPAIVLLGGSEGNDGAARGDAPLWADRGYVAVGLPYYSPAWGDQPQRIPGLPRGFANIPLDTLIGVRDALRTRGDVDADRIGLYGVSKGAEFVLAAASRIDGFAAVAAVAPSDVIWEGWGAGSTGGQTPSFSWQGEPLDFVPYVGIERALGGVPEDERVAMRVPHAEGRAAHPERVEAARIRVEDIDEPVFVLGGGRDAVWDSGDMAARIAAVRAEAGLETDALIFAEAGHGISGPPQTPTRTSSIRARTAGWAALEAFFKRHLKQ